MMILSRTWAGGVKAVAKYVTGRASLSQKLIVTLIRWGRGQLAEPLSECEMTVWTAEADSFIRASV